MPLSADRALIVATGAILHAVIGCGAVIAATAPGDQSPAGVSRDTAPSLAMDPANQLTIMADHYDQDPSRELLWLDKLPVTQGDVAAVIRTFPAAMGNLPPDKIYARAMEIVIREKAMLVRAKMEKLDKDPVVARKMAIASDLALAEAWLQKQGREAVTDKALHALYDKEIAGKPGAAEVRARVILVRGDAEAGALLDSLRNGADFADVARDHSIDPSATSGGDLGYVARDALSPEIANVVFSMAVGEQTTFPVRTSRGFLLVRVEGRRSLPTPSFDEARPRLEQEIRAEAVKEISAALLAKVKVIRQDTPAKP